MEVGLFIRIQILDIGAAAIRTKDMILAAGVIIGFIQFSSRPPPATLKTLFQVLAHNPTSLIPVDGIFSKNLFPLPVWVNAVKPGAKHPVWKTR
jgi:hypothetical protein